MLFISNFVLDLHNISFDSLSNKITIMKKAIISLFVSILVIVSVTAWIFYSKPINPGENIQIILILILAAFGIFIAYRRMQSARSGEPHEDELSKQILQRAAAVSYYISLYLWLVVMYLTDKLKTETEVMFGWGILGMALTFVLSWAFYYFRGLRS